MVRLRRILAVAVSAAVLYAPAAVPAAAQSVDESPDTVEPVESTATESPSPEPTEPVSPSEPAPTESEPSEPAPTQPATSEPAPTEPDEPAAPSTPRTPRPPSPAEDADPAPVPSPPPSPTETPAPEEIPSSGLQVPRVGGMTDSEISLLQERVAQLQAEVDELSEQETDAERAAVEARDRLVAADRAAVRASEALKNARAVARDAEEALAEARDDLAAARTRSDLAADALVRADEDMAAAERVMQQRIRAAYMEGSNLVELSNLVLGVDDFNMVLRVTHLLGAVADKDQHAVDALAVARTIRQDRLASAAAAEAEAARHEATVADAEQEAADARAEAAAAAEQADETAQRLRRRVDRLEEATLEISRPRLELEARLTAARAALENALSGGGVDLVTVWADRGDGIQIGGITVSSVIGQQVQELLTAAAADGIILGGSGYRTPHTTVRLREVNGCPDLYSSPASSCRVPTAIPGTSMHERGLAVDFSYQGRTLCFPYGPSACRGNPGFDWLAANASRFGLQGSSVEAWHWSINGR